MKEEFIVKEMVLSAPGFVEMATEEMMIIDGGSDGIYEYTGLIGVLTICASAGNPLWIAIGVLLIVDHVNNYPHGPYTGDGYDPTPQHDGNGWL